MKNTTDLPPGSDGERVRRVLNHNDSLSEDEAVLEDEAAFDDSVYTVMAVPKELAAAVRELIAYGAR